MCNWNPSGRGRGEGKIFDQIMDKISHNSMKITNQWLENYDSWTNYGLVPTFVNKVLLEQSFAHLCVIYVLWLSLSSCDGKYGVQSLKHLLSNPLQKRKKLPGDWGRRLTVKYQEGILRVMVLFYIMSVVVTTWLYIFVKTHLIGPLKLVNFIVCKLYFNKSNFKNMID